MNSFRDGALLPLHLWRLLRTGPAWKHFQKVTLLRMLVTVLGVLLVAQWVPMPKPKHTAVHGRSSHPIAHRDGGTAGSSDDDDDDDAINLQLGPQLSHDDDDDEKRTLPLPLEWILWLYGITWPVQWVVVLLSRDYDDLFASQLALSAGAAREEAPPNPRPRVDFKWLWVQAKRRLQALLAWAPGVPLVAVLSWPFGPVAKAVSTVLGALWLTYWWLVGTTAKSSLAWATAADARPPFFLRGLLKWTERIPVVRAVPKLWARMTRPLYPPAEAFEVAPVSLSGLALFRAIASLPLISLWARPLLPVAASLLLAKSGHPRPRAPEAQPAAGFTLR
ncbi:MAG: hypothetical protein QM723_39165 [Myxococcaceae bacterium]